MSVPELSLVVPIFDEAAVLRESLSRLLRSLEDLGLPFEVVLSDDGSTDGSREIVIAMAHEDRRIRAVTSRVNEGKGAALQRGVNATVGRWIATCDADLSTELGALPAALRELERGAAVVVGDRRHPDSRIARRQPWLRERLGALFGTLARRAIGSSLRDFTCGFKAYRRDAANEIFDAVETPRWAFDVEVIAIAASLGMRIQAVPVTWRHRRDTRVQLPGDGVRAFLDVLRIGWRYRTGAYSG